MSRDIPRAEGPEATGNVASLECPVPFLVVGDLRRWERLGLKIPSIAGFIFIDFEDVTPEKVADIAPRVVLSPLLCRNFDALEIARRLNDMGYTGQYTVVVKDIPNPSVIEHDVRQVAPSLDFSILKFPFPSDDL